MMTRLMLTLGAVTLTLGLAACEAEVGGGGKGGCPEGSVDEEIRFIAKARLERTPVIQVKTVLGDTRNPDGSWNFFLPGHDRIGYLRITSFAENTATAIPNR